MGPKIRGAPLASEARPPVYDVVGVESGVELKVVLLGDEILGLDHHWVKDATYPRGRSRLCTYIEGDCPYHNSGRALWLGYVAALHMPRKTRVVLRLGSESARELLKVCGRLVTLRGAYLLLAKAGHGETSRAIVETCYEIREGLLPSAHPVAPTLCTMFGVASLPNYEVDVRAMEERWEAEQGGAS